ncbi:vitamin b12 biosynthesis cobw-like protein [Niveomyces insectorum RCEF 264]|uniref:Vitamin b12 biosynthesis cobw-like protein n=1 Tax=Niveomyces insectorum RCEF 264 TaxID=1081102 RepID=A0A167MFN1_9HYPO|nr:vitamin b12 biosynthesis cobw-like protein [Niveomyces insectorum RCEF 264]
MAPTPIPITIVTGFLGAGKTTLILNLVAQLRAANPDYRLALLKNEFGDVAVDSQLAASSAVTGVRELLNGCICCNLVGQLGDALKELTEAAAASATTASPGLARIVIETSGSAFPATLALEVHRLARQTAGAYVLDGVVSVLDVENWRGYEDTSYTAKLQARYTDLVVFNKWEDCDERRFDDCLDRLGALDADTAWVKSHRGWVDAGLICGLDGGLLAKALDSGLLAAKADGQDDHDHDHAHDHQSEVDVVSVVLRSHGRRGGGASVDVTKLLAFLDAAPREEVYRIKAVFSVAAVDAAQLRNSDDSIDVEAPMSTTSNGTSTVNTAQTSTRYILNWAFGRWTFTPLIGPDANDAHDANNTNDVAVLRMTVILARYEGNKWAKTLQTGSYVALAAGSSLGDDGDSDGTLTITKIA